MEVLYLTLVAEIGNPSAEKSFHPSTLNFFLVNLIEFFK